MQLLEINQLFDRFQVMRYPAGGYDEGKIRLGGIFFLVVLIHGKLL